jgi:hypothetical protein
MYQDKRKSKKILLTSSGVLFLSREKVTITLQEKK